MKKKTFQLYNVIFPFWILIGIAPFGGWKSLLLIWGSMLIGNFIIDSGVLWLLLHFLIRKEKRASVWKRSILRIFLFGFLSDVLGSLCGFLCSVVIHIISSESTPEMIKTLFSFLENWMVLFAVFIASFCLYTFNKKFSFSKCRDLLSPKQIRLLSLSLAILTAPYIMLIPPY